MPFSNANRAGEDLDRDNQRHLELKSRLKALQERREKLERLLAVHYPSLRTSDSLFPEWATFDFSAIDQRHTGKNGEDRPHPASIVRQHQVRFNDPVQTRKPPLPGNDARIAAR